MHRSKDQILDPSPKSYNFLRIIDPGYFFVEKKKAREVLAIKKKSKKETREVKRVR